MGDAPYLSPRTLSANTPNGAPAVGSGTFTANGASAPAVQSGIVASARRLVDGGALPFFRVRLNARYPFGVESTTITLGVESPDPAAPLYAALVTDQITPAPADTRALKEIDIAIYQYSDNARVDTAAARVSFQIHFTR